jgi:hypothetical protein
MTSRLELRITPERYIRMAWLPALSKATPHTCYARKHPLCAVQALCGVERGSRHCTRW